MLDVQSNWEIMQGHLQNIEIKRFLRHLWLAESGVVRDKDLFKKIKSKYDDNRSVHKLSRNLRESAEYYAALHDPEAELWTMYDAIARREIARGIDSLATFRVNQYNPLLLSALQNAPDVFPKVLEMVVVFAFRYSIIGSGGTGNIEKAFSNAAVHLRKNPQSSIEDIFADVSHLYPHSEQFRSDFSEKSVTQSAIARYILRKINDHVEDGSKIVNPDSFVVNLEHILPKKYLEIHWAKFADGADVEPDEYVDRLGNMTLLKVGLNSQSSNKSFADKLAFYKAHEPLPIAKYVYGCEEWNYRTVDENQKGMAEIAEVVWRLPYAEK